MLYIYSLIQNLQSSVIYSKVLPPSSYEYNKQERISSYKSTRLAWDIASLACRLSHKIATKVGL